MDEKEVSIPYGNGYLKGKSKKSVQEIEYKDSKVKRREVPESL